MSLINELRGQFRIYICGDEQKDSQSIANLFVGKNYNTKNIVGLKNLDFEIKSQRPHVLILYYKPLSMNFQTMVKKIRDCSPETQIIIVGGEEYWPGIKNLLERSMAHSYWAWPQSEKELLLLNLDNILEKLAYKFIAEQNGPDELKVIQKIEDLELQMQQPQKPVPQIMVRALPKIVESESHLVEHLINHFKKSFPNCEFAYLKNYEPREEVLVYKTSFSLQNFTRGQHFPYTKLRAGQDQQDNFSYIKEKVTELFISNDFVIYPVRSPYQIYGFFIGFQLSVDAQLELESGINFMGLLLRNLDLEKKFASPKTHPLLQREVDLNHLQNLLSREISRSRRTQSPLSCLYVHSRSEEGLDSAGMDFLAIAENYLRVYDISSKVNEKESVIVLPHCSSINAAIKAERLRRLFFKKMQDQQQEDFRIGIGVSSFPELATGPEDLVHSAKDACYQVLNANHNKVCLYTQDEEFQAEYEI